MARFTSAYKPRRKMINNNDETSITIRHTFPLASILWPARHTISQKIVLSLVLMIVGLYKWAASFWGYSGFKEPPRFGDFEAQRHWMEITSHLPISQWYFYDLEWWGLDYPPLTAYHSWLLGKLGSLINPDWFALDTSRGSHDPNLKIYMRATVIISEYLIYIPAMILFIQKLTRNQGTHEWNATVALTAILFQPAIILIDHVHFQYNNVMLGLVIACMTFILAGRFKWSCLFFTLALGFKQMALFYAPTIFAYLLGSCVFPKVNFFRILGISVTTILSFATLLLPIIIGSLYGGYGGSNEQLENLKKFTLLSILGKYTPLIDSDTWYYPTILQLSQVFHRILPFARGLFEDKVANFWCSLNVVVKLGNIPLTILKRASFLSTLASIMPPCLLIFLKPRKVALPLALATTAWGFFLFGFQVHEKTVLLPLMPMTVLLADSQGLSEYVRAWVGFANLLGVWTMYPLLQRVHLRIPYFVLSLLWAYILGIPPKVFVLYGKSNSSTSIGFFTSFSHTLYYILMTLWHIFEAFIMPPESKPDLWAIVNVGIGTTGFFLCYLWCLWNLLKVCGVVNPFPLEDRQYTRDTHNNKLKLS